MKMADLLAQRDRFGVVWAFGEEPRFRAGERVRVSDRRPIGHYRVPTYLRGKRGTVESVIEPMSMDNEEEGYGRHAGRVRHYYRIAFAMSASGRSTRGRRATSCESKSSRTGLKERDEHNRTARPSRRSC